MNASVRGRRATLWLREGVMCYSCIGSRFDPMICRASLHFCFSGSAA